MIYTDFTKKALKLCFEAHKNQTDKSGMPYVFHPFHLAEQMQDEDTAVVALLHDVVEDTQYTLEDIRRMGFGERVMEALALLIHDESVPYMEYVAKIRLNPIARAVKLADLRHNSDLSRLDSVDDRALNRVKKYGAAIKLLEGDFSVPSILADETTKVAQNLLRNHQRQNQIRGCLIGGAVGDALGYPVEFMRKDTIIRKYGADGITEYELTNGVAQISDDTQMTLFTATGLLYYHTWTDLKGIDRSQADCIYLAYLDWLKTQGRDAGTKPVSWIHGIPELHSNRAPGLTCLSALGSGEMGTVEKPINNSKGCGGIMRVAPIALCGKDESVDRIPDCGDRIGQIDEEGTAAAAITHGHPLGYLPAAALVHIIRRCVFGGCEYGDGLTSILRECKETLYRIYGPGEYMDTLFALMDRAAVLAGNDRTDMENISQLGEGWVAEETLAIALYCCLRYPADFDKAVIAAVNHSGDSDSTGAVTGNIMGAVVGYRNIGEKWRKNLELRDVILEIADDLCTENQLTRYNKNEYSDHRWMEKYLECSKPVDI